MFVTLVVNAFDFRDKDDNSDGVDGAKSRIKKIFKTRRSCLLEENYRGSFRPCKLEVIESKHPDEQSNGVPLAIHAGDQDCKEQCKSIPDNTFLLPRKHIFNLSVHLREFSFDYFNILSKSTFLLPAHKQYRP